MKHDNFTTAYKIKIVETYAGRNSGSLVWKKKHKQHLQFYSDKIYIRYIRTKEGKTVG